MAFVVVGLPSMDPRGATEAGSRMVVQHRAATVSVGISSRGSAYELTVGSGKHCDTCHECSVADRITAMTWNERSVDSGSVVPVPRERTASSCITSRRR